MLLVLLPLPLSLKLAPASGFVAAFVEARLSRCESRQRLFIDDGDDDDDDAATFGRLCDRLWRLIGKKWESLMNDARDAADGQKCRYRGSEKKVRVCMRGVCVCVCVHDVRVLCLCVYVFCVRVCVCVYVFCVCVRVWVCLCIVIEGEK